MRKRFVAFVSAATALAGAASATDIAVANADDLHRALAEARPGDTLRLAAGQYGELLIRTRRFSPSIAIVAADPRRPPSFTSVTLAHAGGVRLSGLEVKYGATAAPLTAYAVNVLASADIELSRLRVMSAPNGVIGDDAYGVNIRNSQRVFLRDSRIHDVHRGAAVFDSDDVEISHNVVRAVASDGVVARGVVRFFVLDNYFADFNVDDAAKVHPDAIQIWSRHALRASEYVLIQGNVIRRGRGGPSQGIFVATPEIPTIGLVIENNVVEQSMGQGIAVMNGVDVSIRNNTVIPFDAETDRPGIDVRAPFSNVTVASNIMIAARLAPGVFAVANEASGHNHPDVSAFVRARLSGGDQRESPDDYMPVVSAGARKFVVDLWKDDSAASP
jgi:nitrous oxidase accessory protein NosD